MGTLVSNTTCVLLEVTECSLQLVSQCSFGCPHVLCSLGCRFVFDSSIVASISYCHCLHSTYQNLDLLIDIMRLFSPDASRWRTPRWSSHRWTIGRHVWYVLREHTPSRTTSARSDHQGEVVVTWQLFIFLGLLTKCSCNDKRFGIHNTSSNRSRSSLGRQELLPSPAGPESRDPSVDLSREGPRY
jgi:hypothetical protein